MPQEITDILLKFSNANNIEGVACIDSETGQVIAKEGFTKRGLELLDQNILGKTFNNINSEFNSIFYQRGFPELITINGKETSRFIKLIDQRRLVYTVVDRSANFAKIRTSLKNLEV